MAREKSDIKEQQNEKAGLDEIINRLDEQDSIIHSSDSKANFILVYLVGLLGGLISLIQKIKEIVNLMALGACISLYSICLLFVFVSIVLALLALIPSAHSTINVNPLKDKGKYNDEQYYYQRIITYINVHEETIPFIEKKAKKSKLCFFFSILATFFFSILLILCLVF